ncbi:heterokaryon incompatibility protein-domain-containing protein [Xylaria bambusicola]|uniref:heterokaryon incompatibility protein-domain-containing protein n=1 Tax=Xylaria bambusicola TaxID=326684 RepID=UPI0020075AEB|nr:heterokaryon incompatibility protein-domain-containing protein [Xylaria bambusicola]KAI0528119.1 heterokaryon incompatibility protein-domain-containing protein [Xylaria bambusicola]
MMDTFNYRRLDLRSSAFRLVRLLKGVANDFIDCELVYTSLDENGISYEAVSYTWGSSNKPFSILLDGQKFMVTENLWSLLRDLREAESDRYLWIDAIAINQDDDLERGHQVQRMQAIYGGAERVLVYLGTDSPFTRALLESLLLLQTSISGRYSAPDDIRWKTTWQVVLSKLQDRYTTVDVKGDLQKGFIELLQRSWFRRIWVLQEVANARAASVFCGRNSVRAQIFVMAPILLGVDLNSHAAAIFRLMPSYPGDVSRKTRDRNFLSLLLDFRHSEASDQRDKIFALLGLCGGSEIQKYIVPDYTRTEFSVSYTTFAYFVSMTAEPFQLRLGLLLAEAECLMGSQEMPVSDLKVSPSNWNPKLSELLEEAIQLLRISGDLPSRLGYTKKELNDKLLYLVQLVSRSSEKKYRIRAKNVISGIRRSIGNILPCCLGNGHFPSSINQFLSDLVHHQPKYIMDFICHILSSWDPTDLCSFLQRREVEIDITLDMVKAAAANKFNAAETVNILLRHGRLGESFLAKTRDEDHAWDDLCIYFSDTVTRARVELSPGEAAVTERRENLFPLVFLGPRFILGRLVNQIRDQDTTVSEHLQRFEQTAYEESQYDTQRDVRNCGREDPNLPLPGTMFYLRTDRRRTMLPEGYVITVGGSQTWSLLLMAVLSGERDTVQRLLEMYPEQLNVPCESANMAFKIATVCCDDSTVRCLLNKGVKLTLGANIWNQLSAPKGPRFKRLCDPLSLALNSRDHDLIALFCLYHTSLVPSNPETTPLHIAAMYAHTRLAQFLLEQGANPNATDGCGRTALDIAKEVKRDARNQVSDDLQFYSFSLRDAKQCHLCLASAMDDNAFRESEESNERGVEMVKRTPQKRQCEMNSPTLKFSWLQHLYVYAVKHTKIRGRKV